MKIPIYLDNHATTKMDERVLESMIPFFIEEFANPSSIDHIQGNKVLENVNEARKLIAEKINASEDEIIFTSGATESDNIAITGIARSLKEKGNHIITTNIEHKAILESCSELERNGFEVTYLRVNRKGEMDLEELKNSITDKTILISIMSANNEIGSIFPIRDIGKIARQNGVLFHTDATQIISYKKMDVERMEIDLMSISGHKIYGPKGVGALYVKRGIRINPLIYGGGQERNIRPGTLNVPGIIGLARALELADKEREKNSLEIKRLRDLFLEIISREVDLELNGSIDNRLPNNLSLYIKGIEAKALITKVKEYISISAGSACNTDTVKPSYVIVGMGYEKERAFSTIRLGLSKYNTEKEIRFAAEKLSQNIGKMLNFFN
jgi:cysteine desulfurase